MQYFVYFNFKIRIMIAVITGDIISSRKLSNQDKWILPLKELFDTWGDRPRDWELERGDYFQVEIKKPEEALIRAFQIKALIKKVKPEQKSKTHSSIDVRISIGVGNKTYSGESIKESNGSAFIHAGEKFDRLKKENTNIGIQTPWKEFDEEINLYLKLSSVFMDKWSISSAELIDIILQSPKLTQEEVGEILGIKQSGVSGRWNRTHVDKLLEVEKAYRKKITTLIQ